MSIRFKLFATATLPFFAAALAVQPALADRLKAPFEVAQEGGELSPEELQQLKKRKKQRAAEEESQGQAEEQQRAEEKARRRAEREQQREAEHEAQQAEEQQNATRKKRQAEKQRAAEEKQQRQAEEQQRAEEKARRRAEREQQRAAEQEAQQAEEQENATRKKRQAEKQRAAEEKQQHQAEEQQRAEEKARRRAEREQQRAAEQEAQRAEEQENALRKKRNAEEQRAAEEKQQRRAEEQQRAAEEAEDQEKPPRNERQAEKQRRAEQQRAAELLDERTQEEKLKIAEDPASTDETVVLPVERGAAVLDSDKDADNISGNRAREARRKQREELRARAEQVTLPTDDAAAQVAIPAVIRDELPRRIEALLREEGERVEEVPAFAVPDTTNIVNNTIINNTVINNTTEYNVTEVTVVEETENRVILEAGDRIFVRGDDRPRLRRDAQETFYEELPRGRYRETIVRPDGYRIVTVYNRYGDILQRTRIDSDDNEYVLIYAPEYEERRRPAIVDVGYELPPMRLAIPVDEYIVDYADEPDRDYYEFLAEPPVEPVERVYTIDEVRHSARLRDKVRRIDLDTITFATGSAEVSMSQAKTLRKVADAMAKILAKDPGETFFIEGHTDAVGSDRSNLVLSDERAESVASLLSEVYGIPPENLVTQGYGERFLKIRTPEAEQENRRVTIRRVTPLVRPVAQR